MRADRPSSTALLIARCTLLAARDPALSLLVPPGTVDPLTAMLAAAGGDRWFNFALRHGWTRALMRAVERAVLPGISAHYLARKRWLEARAVAALDAGGSQLAVLGAGFDTLAWRLHGARPSARLFEIDHPATQRPKAVSLAPTGNLALLAADLSRALPTAVLRADGRFDFHSRTCFVAEGLLMYFSERRVQEILSDLARVPGAEVAFTFMAPGPDGRAAFRGGSAAIGAWLHLRREPFTWAIPPDSVAAFLRPLGLSVRLLAGAAGLREQILAPAGLGSIALAEGEHLCLAATVP